LTEFWRVQVSCLKHFSKNFSAHCTSGQIWELNRRLALGTFTLRGRLGLGPSAYETKRGNEAQRPWSWCYFGMAAAAEPQFTSLFPHAMGKRLLYSQSLNRIPPFQRASHQNLPLTHSDVVGLSYEAEWSGGVGKLG